MEGKEKMGCCLKKSIYGLKQASRQWYLKFDKTIKEFGFKENIEDNCVYAKFKNGKYIFLILYVDDILLASSDASLLLETKSFLSSHFEMKDLGEARFVLRIEIHRDRVKRILGLKMATGTKYPRTRGYHTRWARIRVWICARGYGRGYNSKPNGYFLTGMKK
jgi:hypothetical protein